MCIRKSYRNKKINYESIFNNWVRRRSTATFGMWFPVGLSVLFFASVIWQILQEAESTSSVIVFSMFYVALATIFSMASYGAARRERIKISREAAIFAARSTIEELDNRNLIKSALSLKIMLLALSDYLNKKTIKLGERLYPPIKFIGVNPSLLLKRNLSLYIQTQCDIPKLKFRLRKITSSLIRNRPLYYLDISNFLIWLDQNTKDVGESEQSFTDGHPLLIMLLPTIVGALGIVATVVVAIVK